MTPANLLRKVLLPATFTGLFVVAGGAFAHAQPGATPPGSVPPGPPPAPDYGPQPAPDYGPQPAPDYGPQPAPDYGPPPANAYAPPPEPYGPLPPSNTRNERRGWNIGISAGVGIMDSDTEPLPCRGCDGDPPTGAFDLHVGTMLTPRFALQGEVWLQSRDLDADGMDSIRQDMLMIAGQYWLTPRLWLKAGIGYAGLTINYFDGVEDQSEKVGEGLATMFAVGYELMHSRGFGLDVQIKTGTGYYSESDDQIQEEMSTGAIALGLNWY